MGRVLNDFQAAALRQAYELSIKYLVTPPDNASAAQSAMGEIVAALDDVVNYPNHVYSGPIQGEMFGGLMAKWDPRKSAGEDIPKDLMIREFPK